MKGIERRNWLAKGNKLSDNLMDVSVIVNIKAFENNVYYEVKITDSYMNESTVILYSFEDVMDFVENVLSKCKTTAEAVEKYNELFEAGCLMKPETSFINEMDLSVSQVKDAMTDYYGNDKDHAVYPFINVFMNNGEPDVKFYINEHVGKGQSYNTPVSKDDLRNVLAMYAAKKGYEMIDYRYVGGVHRVGYFFDEDTPHFDGIKLYVKKLEKGMVLSKKQDK